MRPDGRTNMMKLTVAFRNFANAPKNVYRSSCKLLLILVRFNLNFPDRFSKNTQIQNFTKIRPLEAELFHAGGRMVGRTDRTKLIDAFRNVSYAPKNQGNNRCLFSDPHKTHTNRLCGQNVEFYINTQSVSHSKHTPSRLYKPAS